MILRFVVIEKKWIFLIALCVLLGFAASSLSLPEAEEAGGSPSTEKEFIINMVTGEFKSQTADGKEIEAYRWDPGTIYIPKNKDVKLSIYGVNGKEHPYMIEGTDIKGTVEKGKETIVNVRFEKEGIYRLICLSHPDIEHNGPMIAYLVVD